ncbi:MAG: aldehyde dehydrogenase [Verrucomicrobiales bacterium]|nr:aldehyde dehydrogenase [Verrucomicrobiales bacterium]|tara:strand:- start:10391 stop:11263 length:873 start_codon:yes stop_codon:yes gene_type:complete
MANRLNVRKTYKLYIGGKFARSESGRVLMATSPSGEDLDNYSHASRKDFRDSVVAARKAQSGWAKSTAYLKGQILYRAAEMLEGRQDDLAKEVSRSHGVTMAKARSGVATVIDRLVYYAGWTDKYQQIFGSVNPVATSHFNFTTPEPTGVVVIAAPDEPVLLPMISLLAPVILSGNAAIVIPSPNAPLPALSFAEILATSDLPGGVVNILAGPRDELAKHASEHMDVNAIVDATGNAAFGTTCQAGVATNLKRYVKRSLNADDWFGEAAEDPYWILDTVEQKTAWHPIGV